MYKSDVTRIYEMMIGHGDPAAMFNYALLLEKGDGVDMNKSKAIKYYKMAIEKDFLYAMIHYAIMMDKGEQLSISKKLQTKVIYTQLLKLVICCKMGKEFQ